VAPAQRGILPLDGFRASRRLRRTVRRGVFEVRIDSAFADVITACAEPRADHDDTWINAGIARVFCELHELGYAHSVETWRDGRLAGGLYGLALGGAFFGESMFSAATDASKVALVHLVALLRLGGFALLDVQFVTDHLRQFGVTEMPAADYLQALEEALLVPARFYSAPDPAALSEALSDVLSAPSPGDASGAATQSSTQTS
jgi:leucyl/phenylalanyl-tRNA--protein transferase